MVRALLRSAHRRLMESEIYVSAFLDHRRSAPAFFNGVPVLHPSSALDGVVVLGIHNRDANILEIIQKLNEFGTKHIISPVELFDFQKSSPSTATGLPTGIFTPLAKPLSKKGNSC